MDKIDFGENISEFSPFLHNLYRFLSISCHFIFNFQIKSKLNLADTDLAGILNLKDTQTWFLAYKLSPLKVAKNLVMEIKVQ